MTAEERKTTEEAWHDLENILIQSNIKPARLLTIKNMIEVYADIKALSIIKQAVGGAVNDQILQNGLRPEIIRKIVHEVLTELPLQVQQAVRRKMEGG